MTRLKKLSPAHAAWKKYYHYLRLEKHGDALPWHGRKAWIRVVLTGLALLAIVAYGFYHTL